MLKFLHRVARIFLEKDYVEESYTLMGTRMTQI